MSHDPQYISPLHRAPAPSRLDSTRPAVLHRARVVEIKRRRPSSTHTPALPTERQQQHQHQQQSLMDAPRYGASPPPRADGLQTASMSVSPSRARNHVLSHCDAPPPLPPHSPSLRSISIARGSYMDYKSGTPPPRRHQQRGEYGSKAYPSVAHVAPGFAYEMAAEVTPHQSAPPPLPPRTREAYEPRRLLPTAVRPSQAFLFELEEDPLQHSSSELDIPGRFPSSPDTMRPSVSSQVGGLQEQTTRLRPKVGSYRELQPYELGMVYSNPVPYEISTLPSDQAQHDMDNPAQSFLYEVKSPRKGEHTESNKTTDTSKQAAYSARNPAEEAESYRVLRRLGADERYATSFRTRYDDGTPGRVVADDHGEEGMVMDDVET